MEETIDIRTLQCYQKATEKQREKIQVNDILK